MTEHIEVDNLLREKQRINRTKNTRLMINLFSIIILFIGYKLLYEIAGWKLVIGIILIQWYIMILILTNR